MYSKNSSSTWVYILSSSTKEKQDWLVAKANAVSQDLGRNVAIKITDRSLEVIKTEKINSKFKLLGIWVGEYRNTILF